MAWPKSLKGELATCYDVREIDIFGSVAWEEHDDVSDIDFLVEFGSDADLLSYIGLWQYIEDSFGIKIDLVSQGGLRREMRDAVMRDVLFIEGMNTFSFSFFETTFEKYPCIYPVMNAPRMHTWPKPPPSPVGQASSK